MSATLNTIHNIESEVASMDPEASLQRRRAIIREVDEKGLIATPANSYINELVVEAARMSILRDGEPVRIVLKASRTSSQDPEGMGEREWKR